LLITGEPPKQAEDRKKPNPSACTGLAEHLLPRRHELFQSFPSGWVWHWARSCQVLNSIKAKQSNRAGNESGIGVPGSPRGTW